MNERTPTASAPSALRVRLATPADLGAIDALNYRTFVEELPQHAPNEARRLRDPLLERSTTYVCEQSGRIVGMVVVNGTRPFSLDAKLEDLDRWLPPECRHPCEVRLLAVEPELRGGSVAGRLFLRVRQHCADHGHDSVLISGTERQRRLYCRLGFVPFGPRLGTAECSFQGMALGWDGLGDSLHRLEARLASAAPAIQPAPSPELPILLLPGPVTPRPAVRRAFEQPAVSHRAAEFVVEMDRLRHGLSALTGAQEVAILLGSGTLANDAIAAQLCTRSDRGLVVSTGEFGERLCDHARRFGLRFERQEQPWGRPPELERIARALDEARDPIGWLWLPHCETSSGALLDLEGALELCRARGVDLCLDAISSLGTLPVDLGGVHLASGVSGKGLASYPGLALVFADHPFDAGQRIPRYLDLAGYSGHGSVPFTHSSNLVHALIAALTPLTDEALRAQHFQRLAQRSAHVHARLTAMDLTPEVPPDQASPAVITLRLDAPETSVAIGEALEREGIHLSYRSEYLVAGNLIQICLMGACGIRELEHALTRLGACLGPRVSAR